MIIENRHVHIVLWLKNLIATIIYVLLVFAIYLTRIFNDLIPGLDKNHYTIIFGIFYIGILIYPNILKYSYISFSDKNGTLTLNYYLFGFFSGQKNSIKIPVREFYGFRIQNSLMGLRKSLVLYKKVGDKVAKYPPVSLTALSKEQQQGLFRILSHYSPDRTKG